MKDKLIVIHHHWTTPFNFNQGLSYSTLNTAYSALSTIVVIHGEGSFGGNHIVTRFMKGVFGSHRPRPKYYTIWDVSVFLKHLSSLYPTAKLSSKNLTHKVLMFISFKSTRAIDTLLIHLQHLTTWKKIIIPLTSLSISRPVLPETHIHVWGLRLLGTSQIVQFALLACLKAYINKTRDLHNN